MSENRIAAITTGVLVAGAAACGLAVLPSAALGAERFAVPKELAVHATAALAALACLLGRLAIIDRRSADLDTHFPSADHLAVTDHRTTGRNVRSRCFGRLANANQRTLAASTI